MAHPAVDALRVKAHGDAVRTLHDQGLTWVPFDPIPDLVCDIDFGIRKLPELGLLSGTVRGVRHVHAHRDSGDGNDDFSLHLNVSGLSTVVSRRGETTLRDGDAMLLSYSAGLLATICRSTATHHDMSEMRRKDHRSDTLFIAMREDIYEAPKGIANIEASKAPFFSGWTIFDGEPFCLHAPQSLFQVVNLDGYLGNVCA